MGQLGRLAPAPAGLGQNQNSLTATGLVENLDHSPGWVKARIGAFEHLGVRSDLRGRWLTLYPALVVGRLRQVRDNDPDSSWLSTNGIARAIGCDWAWVAARTGRYRNLTATRRYYGRSVVVYPPEIVVPLRCEYEAVKRYGGALLTLGELSRRTGRTRAWCLRWSRKLGFEPLPRRMPRNNRVVPHWTPEAEQALQRFLRELVPAGDWLTAQQLHLLTGLHAATIQSRLKKLDVTSEWRLTFGSNQIAKHWPPEVAAEIAKCPHDAKSCRCVRAND